MTTDEHGLAEAFVDLADTLVADYDIVDLMDRLATYSVRLLAAETAGLLLSDKRGALRLLAASNENTRMLELYQLQSDEGPCLDCVRSGEPVSAPDLRHAATRWPEFAPVALERGFGAVHALPLRLRSETIGGLNLFYADAGELSARDRQWGQALADVATIGILNERTLRRSETLVEQLQTALNSRVVIEQAKGVLAERGDTDLDQAFTTLREVSRAAITRLSDTARRVVEDRQFAQEVLEQVR